MAKASIIGSPLSPYVRKVLVACELKGVTVELDPIVPFFGSDAFTAISPLRRIPVYRDDLVELCDSSVICQYLEDRWPSPALYPGDIAMRARARWLEEFADTRMGDVFIWKLFNNSVIAPAVFGSGRDSALRDRTLANDVPDIMDYLQAQITSSLGLLGEPGIADLSVAPHFANVEWSRVNLDWARWPGLRSWLDNITANTPLGRYNAIAQSLLTSPPQSHRDHLAGLGVPLTPTTLGTGRPRKGPMSV